MTRPPSAARCRGQAMTEYVVIVLLVVVVLIASSGGSSPVGALVDAIKRAYNAFSYVISFSV